MMLTALTALLLLPATFAAATAAEVGTNQQARVLRFPGDRPVGQIHVQNEGTGRKLASWFHWAGINGLPGTPWVYFGEAQGDVRVPAGTWVQLTVNVDSWHDLTWLTKLRPDDLYGLGFACTDQRVKPGDARLKSVTHLTGLKKLALDNTDVTDWGMKMLAGLPSLESLSLNAKVTDRSIAHVASLSSLKRLYFPGDTKVTSAGLKHISRLTDLEELYLGQGIGDAGLAHLRGLPKLKYLAVYGPGFTDAGIVHLAKMRSLKKLEIGSSQVTDKGLSHLGQIKTLEHLDLPQDQHGITDAGLAHLAELPNLKHLQISRIHFNDPSVNKEYYTDRGLAELARLHQLEELHIGSIGITDAGMDHVATLTHLKTLHLFGCDNVTDRGLAKLTTLRSLKNLDITHAQLTLAGLAAVNAMSSLTRLDVKDLERGGAVLNLAGLKNLEDLTLNFAPNSQEAFGDADIACLANLKKLRWLQIGPRDFTDRGMLHLAGLTEIDRLGLGGAGLTDEGLKHLANLQKLDLLNIRGRFDENKGHWGPGGHITDKGLRYLEAFPRLVFVEIYSDSDFSADAVQRLWEQLPNLYHLNLNGSNARPSGIGVK